MNKGDLIAEEIEENTLLLKLSKSMYEREAVFAAAYKFTGKCVIKIEPIGEFHVGIYLQPKKDSTLSLTNISHDLCNELLDQQLRLDLEKRNGKLRELIVKHAFSPIKNLNEILEDYNNE